jgi:hypothetical protein
MLNLAEPTTKPKPITHDICPARPDLDVFCRHEAKLWSEE